MNLVITSTGIKFNDIYKPCVPQICIFHLKHMTQLILHENSLPFVQIPFRFELIHKGFFSGDHLIPKLCEVCVKNVF